MLRWRNWRLNCVGVQDRALKLCPALICILNCLTEMRYKTDVQFTSQISPQNSHLKLHLKNANLKTLTSNYTSNLKLHLRPQNFHLKTLTSNIISNCTANLKPHFKHHLKPQFSPQNAYLKPPILISNHTSNFTSYFKTFTSKPHPKHHLKPHHTLNLTSDLISNLKTSSKLSPQNPHPKHCLKPHFKSLLKPQNSFLKPLTSKPSPQTSSQTSKFHLKILTSNVISNFISNLKPLTSKPSPQISPQTSNYASNLASNLISNFKLLLKPQNFNLKHCLKPHSKPQISLQISSQTLKSNNTLLEHLHSTILFARQNYLKTHTNPWKRVSIPHQSSFPR